MKILLITGGDSSEREVSLNSAANVQKALEENGHKVDIYDLRQGYEPIKGTSKQYDLLFPVLHGEEGEGGKLHKFLSQINKPIVGTRNYKGFREAWLKIPLKKWCDKNGIKTAPWKEVKEEKDFESFDFPCVLKASNGGSSKEVAILKSREDLGKEDVKRILDLDTQLFVEKYLSEVTSTILDNKALPLVEIIPPENSWFSYENKYSSTTQEVPFAPSVPKQVQEDVQATALNIHAHFGLGSYSRIDFIITDSIPYVLDVNTIPGLTEGSLLPKSAKAAGMSFNEFLEEILKTAS